MNTQEKRPKRGRCKRIAGVLLVCLFCAFLFMAAYLLGIEEWQEFDTASVEQMQQCTLLYDSSETVYQQLYDTERRYYVSLDALPVYVGQAFIAIEDARFYEHSGFDLIRMGGALLHDLKAGSFEQGASTITQQLIKLSCLSSQKTVTRKVAEVLMAIQLEREYSKDEILELYLNRAYFGNGAYGIEAAAREYFGCEAAQLSEAQAALLAGLVKSPSGYDPRLYPEAALSRQQLVLSNMQTQGFLTSEACAAAKQEPLTFAPHMEQGYTHGYYTDRVIEDAARILTLTYGEVMSGGYHIYTYLDREIQQGLEAYCQDPAAFPAPAADGELCQCAAVVLRAGSNGVAAMVGGREHTTRLAFNRACNMRRQPGSAIKPVLVFAPALEYLGCDPTTLLQDEPEDFLGYTPRNAGNTYRGWVTLRDAAAYSLNLPAVRLLNQVGVRRAKSYGAAVGIPFEEQDHNLSLALGGFTTGVSPLELAAAYMPFASGGYYDAPGTIACIKDGAGNVLYTAAEQGKNVLSEESAYLTNSLLSSAVEYGTAKALQGTGAHLCAKTGTSTYDDAANNKDAWIVAYDPRYIVCCWMGFDNTDDAHSLEQGVTGGTYPARMAAAIFKGIYAETEGPAFSIPEGIAAVEIDAYRLETRLELRLAAGDGQKRTEYYRENAIPAALSPKATQMQAWAAEGGIRVQFQGYEGYTYVLERRAMGSGDFTMVTRLQGGEGFTDTTADPACSYVYRLVPEAHYTAQYETLYLYVPSEA